MVTLGLIGGITLLSTFSASAMTSNMQVSSMNSMKHTSEAKMQMNHWSVANIAQYLGYNWKNDKSRLAGMAGITNYRGTAKQNLMIKKYLLTTAKESVTVGGAPMIKIRDIVDNAVRASNVKTLVAAVQAAGLVETLKSEGPFTVFAPTDSAFAKLPTGTVETLMKPENKAKLTTILTYHVVAGRYKTSDITDGLTLKTVQGGTLTFKKDANGKIWINGSAMIETKDVISTNGVTHVIDTVLLPE
jgi:uncharacterized surface protein with fasciclin (FAS1) repeats